MRRQWLKICNEHPREKKVPKDLFYIDKQLGVVGLGVRITLIEAEFPKHIYSQIPQNASGPPSLPNKPSEIAEEGKLIPILARVASNWQDK